MERHYTTMFGGMSTPHTTIFFGCCWLILGGTIEMAKVKEKSVNYMQQQPKGSVAAVVAAGAGAAATSSQTEIGMRMKVARESLGLSRPAFTTKCGGITVRTLENNEGGANEAGAGLIAAFVHLGINANWLLTGEGPMLLIDLAAPAGALDIARLQLAIETVEEGLQATGRNMPPAKKAELALAVYDLYADGTAKERILRLVKSAA